jgi:hypothetical protein
MSNTPNCGPTAGESGEPDPIFASIEWHRAASCGWQTTYDRLAEKSGDCIDAPERIEANTAFLAANEELGKALEAVLSSPPTTIAGVADLFDYIGSLPPAPGLLCAFLPMIAATLPRGATGGPDPIFAAIERHRAALRGWVAAKHQHWRLRRIIPKARRRWESDEKPLRCTDAPEWIEANTALIEAYEELDKALEDVLSSPPTTIAAVADLLDYVGREEWEVAGEVESSGGGWYGTILDSALINHDQALVENPACLVEAVQKAAAKFLPMIAATLRALAAQSTGR